MLFILSCPVFLLAQIPISTGAFPFYPMRQWCYHRSIYSSSAASPSACHRTVDLLSLFLHSSASSFFLSNSSLICAIYRYLSLSVATTSLRHANLKVIVVCFACSFFSSLVFASLEAVCPAAAAAVAFFFCLFAFCTHI